MSADPNGQIELDLYRLPSEDVGAPTAGNYHYQTEIIASFCLCMPADLSILKIICEWHEDFILVRDTQPFLELVSVKHHDRLVYTTMKMLCIEGGIAHLFDRWLGYTSSPAARLASNTSLGGRPGEPSPRALLEVGRSAALATSRGTALLSHLAWALMDVARTSADLENVPKPTSPSPPKARRGDPAGLPAGLFDLLFRFMLVCRFDCERPRRQEIQDVNIRRLAIPVTQHLGYSSTLATDVYKAVADLAAMASRDDSGRPADLARYLTRPGAYDPLSDMAQTVERRTVSREAVLAAARSAARRSAGGDLVQLLGGSELSRRSS